MIKITDKTQKNRYLWAHKSFKTNILWYTSWLPNSHGCGSRHKAVSRAIHLKIQQWAFQFFPYLSQAEMKSYLSCIYMNRKATLCSSVSWNFIDFFSGKRTPSYYSLYSFLRGSKGKKHTRKETGASIRVPCMHVRWPQAEGCSTSCMTVKDYCIWLKDISQNKENTVRKVNEKIYTMLISFFIIFVSFCQSPCKKFAGTGSVSS